MRGDAFEDVMGAEWAGLNPEIPFFQTKEQVARLQDRKQLGFGDACASIARFLVDERVFADRSEEVEALRKVYRGLYKSLTPGFWQELEEKLVKNFSNPETCLQYALLGLSMLPEDPRKDPESWKLWLSAGFACVQLGKLDRAAIYLEQAIAVEPRAVPAMNELSSIRLRQNRLQEGEALLAKILELEPDNLLALCNYAGLRIQAGRISEALPLLQRARIINPEDPFLKELLAMLP